MNSKKNHGAALVVVLSVILLLTGLVVAYLSNALMQRRISSQSAGQAQADLLARSALSVIVGDLRREIVLGSDADTNATPIFYLPKTAAAILPERSGNPPGSPDPIPNLIRRSVRNDPISVPSRASAVNSADDVSMNGRSVCLSRWNAHYLVPKSDPINGASDPIAEFKAPDWVLVTRSGVAVKTDADVAAMRDPAAPDRAIGRYAYAIYDAGGLLDMNVAGYLSAFGLSTAQTSAKGSLAFAELNCLPNFASEKSLNDICGWRNFATLQASGDFGLHNFSFGAGTSYFEFALNNPADFLKVAPVSWHNQTDQMFTNRQALIAMRRSLQFRAAALLYLGTFSRDLNLPTLPRVLKLRAARPFARRDNSTSITGEPLLHRFALDRLTNLKCLPPASPSTVQRDFGLVALAGTDGKPVWCYCGVSGTSVKSSLDNSWTTKGGREPDFFELIALGLGGNPSLADVLAVGAKIMDEFDEDKVATRIGFLGLSGSIRYAVGAEGPRSLNRRFQSVGELRYAAGTTDDMLDLFCARKSEEAVRLRAGVVNRNTRNTAAIAAILAGAYKKSPSLISVLSGSNARATANEFTGIAQSRGEGLGNVVAPTGDSVLVSRALADVATTRVWNLMIDVVAQSGRFASGAVRLNQFVVEGESRYWLHIALDRFTGRILDVQSESVRE
jgi:type II secretory pathway component PulK